MKKKKAAPLSEQSPGGSTTRLHRPQPRRENSGRRRTPWMDNFFLRKAPPIWMVIKKDR